MGLYPPVPGRHWYRYIYDLYRRYFPGGFWRITDLPGGTGCVDVPQEEAAPAGYCWLACRQNGRKFYCSRYRFLRKCYIYRGGMVALVTPYFCHYPFDYGLEHPAKKTKAATRGQGILLFLGIILSLQYSTAQGSATKFLKKLAVQDLEYLREALKNTHPFPFAYTSEADFNHVVDIEIQALEDTVDYYTLRNAARRIVYYVHCVHSTVLARHITKKEALYLADKYFPLELRWIGKEFYVFRNYSRDSTIRPGYKIRAINGYTMEQISDSIKTYRSGDGPEDDFIRGLINLPFQFNFLYDLQFPEDYRYFIEYYDSSNRICKDTLPAIYEPNEILHEEDTIQYAYINKHRNVRFRFLEKDIAYLQIADFDGLQNMHYNYIFKMIDERKTPHLVIDLRYNYGGGMDNANHLLSYIVDTVCSFSLETPVKTKEFDYYDGGGMVQRIAGIVYFNLFDQGTSSIKNKKWCWQSFIEPRRNYNYNGQVYILINEHTLSAASYLASQLKHKASAILIGSPSGGGEFGNAGYTYTTFTLPNSNSKVKVPHNWINYDIEFASNHELYPQYMVQPQIDDMIGKKDVVMEKALEIIRSKH